MLRTIAVLISTIGLGACAPQQSDNRSSDQSRDMANGTANQAANQFGGDGVGAATANASDVQTSSTAAMNQFLLTEFEGKNYYFAKDSDLAGTRWQVAYGMTPKSQVPYTGYFTLQADNRILVEQFSPSSAPASYWGEWRVDPDTGYVIFDYPYDGSCKITHLFSVRRFGNDLKLLEHQQLSGVLTSRNGNRRGCSHGRQFLNGVGFFIYIGAGTLVSDASDLLSKAVTDIATIRQLVENDEHKKYVMHDALRHALLPDQIAGEWRCSVGLPIVNRGPLVNNEVVTFGANGSISASGNMRVLGGGASWKADLTNGGGEVVRIAVHHPADDYACYTLPRLFGFRLEGGKPVMTIDMGQEQMVRDGRGLPCMLTSYKIQPFHNGTKARALECTKS